MNTFYEFFAGGGLARIGLGPGWDCLFANDIDRAKCAAYRANFPDAPLTEGDVHDLTAADLPGRADLAWASFPCQDLSLAGARAGLAGARSSAFHGFWRLMAALAAEGRAPRTIVIENVSGLASSDGGRDLAVVTGALAAAGYAHETHVIDAADFLPQSRPRMFVIGWNRTLGPGPLALPAPPRRNARLAEIVEDAPWAEDAWTARQIAMMAPAQRARLGAALDEARRTGAPVYGAGFRRIRKGAQRLEARWDMAGCLRTPTGGSSRQILIAATAEGPRARLMTGREALRLMGAPDSYVAPKSESRTLKIAGDGVAVPVVRHLAEHALEPLLRGPLEPAAAAE